MKAVINCGGKGTRLPEVSTIIPKPMVEINGKPLLLWHIENLKKYGIHDIYITLHHLPEKIMNYFEDGKNFGVTISYSIEKELLGTGGALLPIKDHLDKDTILIYGDIVSQINFKKLSDFHKKKKALVTAVVHPSSHPEDSDLVTFDKNSKLLTLNKKPHITIPASPYNLAALYVFSPDALKYLTMTPPFDIAQDVLPLILSKENRVFCYNTNEFIMDAGTPERLKKIKTLFK